MNIWAFLSQAWYCGCSSHLFRNLHFPGILNWQWSRSLAQSHMKGIFIIFLTGYRHFHLWKCSEIGAWKL
jgi:hypothetical protein